MKVPIFFVFELGYTIAIPAVVFTVLGHFADKAFETAPIFTLIGVLGSIPIAAYAVYRKLKPFL